MTSPVRPSGFSVEVIDIQSPNSILGASIYPMISKGSFLLANLGQKNLNAVVAGEVASDCNNVFNGF